MPVPIFRHAASDSTGPSIQPRVVAAERLRRWLGAGLDLVFPPGCAFCHNPLETSAPGLLCPTCQDHLIDQRPACGRCGCTIVGSRGASTNCPHCVAEKFHFDATVRLGPYEGMCRTAVLRVKRASQRALALALGDLLAAVHRDALQALAPEAIVPIPMHWSRRMWRGANSPETISERLSRKLGVPLAPHLLARRRRTAPQAHLSPSRRLANVRGAFRAAAHADLPGARLLLVDDIMTTGATVNEAAKVLRRAGAAFVGVAVLARAEGMG